MNLSMTSAKSVTTDADLQTNDTEEDLDVLLIVVVTLGVFAVTVAGLLLFKRRRRRLQRAARKDHHELSESLIQLQRQQVETLLEGFQLSKPTLENLMQLLDQEMCKSLNESTRSQADVKLFPTHVRHRPGLFVSADCLVISLEMERKHMWMFLVELDDIEQSSKIKQSYLKPIPPNVQGGTGRQLCDFIADCAMTFLQSDTIFGTFWVLMVPFPYKDPGHEKAGIAKWATEFQREGVVVDDLKRLLKDALQEVGSWKYRSDLLDNVEVVCVVNDTVSTLVSVAHSNPQCKISLLVGSRLNACYVEDNWTQADMDCTEEERASGMIINAELGTLGENGCLDFCRTSIDRQLDEQSGSPGSHVLEKMVGELYIGEMVRLTLEKLTKEGVLFRDVPRGCDLFHRGSLSAYCVVTIERDEEEAYPMTTSVLDTLEMSKYSDEDIKTVRLVCKLVCERAAFLTAASLATLINRVNQPEVTVVVDGYVYRRHPRFHDLLYSKTLELVKPGLKFYFVSPRRSPDPIGGARIVVAVKAAWDRT